MATKKQRKVNLYGVDVTLLKVGKKWMFCIPVGIFRQPFISKTYPTKRETTHSAIELIAALQNRAQDPDQLK